MKRKVEEELLILHPEYDDEVNESGRVVDFLLHVIIS